MSNKNIQLVVFLGALAIVGILSAQIYWVMRSYNLQEQEFHQSVELALIKVAESIEEFNGTNLPTKDLINRRASNYYVVNINDVIDANNLEFYLQKEFEKSALNMDFEYGIYDCTSDRMVYGNYMSSGDAILENPTTALPTYDEFTYYFGVRFPNMTAEVLSNMWLVIMFTLLLLCAISFFVYALSVILKQKRLSEMQKDFINNMTHEFKTPLSTIAISSNVFLKDPYIQENPRLNKYAQLIKDQGSRLSNHVEKVLQIVKVENDSFQLNLETVDLVDLLDKTVSNIELKMDAKADELNIDLPSEAFWVTADPVHTGNIIENLLDNAIKYVEKKPLKLSVIAKNIGSEISVSVTDNGQGIPQEYQQKVFEKFFRVPTGNVHDVKGFGLGLFYVKNICKQHGWPLKMESDENGTRFNIVIPRVKEMKRAKKRQMAGTNQ